MAGKDDPVGGPGTGFEFRLLGPLEVLHEGVAVQPGSPAVRSLLAALLLEPNQIVPIERLIDTLWDETPPDTARTIVHGYISRLRKLFAAHAVDGADPAQIIRRAPGYLLRVDSDRIDAHRARALIDIADGREAAYRSRKLSEALSLWRGPVLAGVPSARLHRTFAPNLTELHLIALEERIEADLELGRHHRLIVELSTLVDQYPLRERLTKQLMLASYRAGHRAEAQTRYHALRERLSYELGIDPGPELRWLYERLLQDDESLLYPVKAPQHDRKSTQRPTPAELPPAIADFVGRGAEVATLDRLLAARPEGVPLVAVVTGAAGVGKTALAITWTRRVAHQFPDGQLYVPLRGFDPERNPLSAGEALTSMLQALGVAADAIPLELDDRVALYRSLLADRKVLVLLDNARDSEQVRPLLPGGSASLVVVTSRQRLDGLVVQSGARLLPLDILPTETAIELLDRAGAPGMSTVEPVAARRLAEFCGGLPLALRIAAARLAANPGREVASLVQELTEESNRLHALDIDDSDTSVRRAFDISYRSLHPVHAETFRRLGLMPGTTFSYYAVAALCGTDPISARRRLRALALAHLVTETGSGRFGMHDLLRLYAHDLATTGESEEEENAALRRLLGYYLAVADHARRLLRPAWDELDFVATERVERPTIHDRTGALQWFDAEWPNLVAAIGMAKVRGWHEITWSLVRLQFNYLMVRCPWDDWTQIYGEGLDSARKAGEVTATLLMSAGLGVAYARSGRPGLALAHYAESYRNAVATGDPGWLAMTRVNMGSVLFRLGRYAEAAVYCRRALRTYRDLRDRFGEAHALNNLAQVEQVGGQLDEALEHLRQAEERYREADDLETLAMVLNNCGEVSTELGRLEEAERYHQKALDVAQRCGSAMRQAAAYLGLGDAATARGDRSVARTRWDTALVIFETSRSPRAAEVRKRLAGALPSA